MKKRKIVSLYGLIYSVHRAKCKQIVNAQKIFGRKSVTVYILVTGIRANLKNLIAEGGEPSV